MVDGGVVLKLTFGYEAVDYSLLAHDSVQLGKLFL
jgi:hypothetical protein